MALSKTFPIKQTVKKYAISNEDLEFQINEIVAGKNIELLLMDNMNLKFDLEPGEIIKGKVILLRDDQVIVDISHKSEGFLAYKEPDRLNDDLDIGDETDFLVKYVDDNGIIHLSRKDIELIMHRREVAKTLKVGDRLVGRLLKQTAEGWLVEVNKLEALLPTHQEYLLGEPGELVNLEVEVDVEAINGVNVILTRKAFANEVKKLAKNHFISTLEVGHIVDGTVKNITDFGLFIQVASGIIGLCHSSDKGDEPLHVGQKLKARVLKIDRDKNRVSLGVRQVKEPSWNDLVKKYAVDQRLMAEVKSLVPYGAFMELESGVTGLVHVSDLSWSDHIKHPKEVLGEGEKIEVIILAIDPDKQHLSLGIKQITSDPWETISDRYLPGSMVDGTVTNKTKFGIFVELEKGVEGLAHHTINSKNLKVGDTTSVSVLRVDAARKKVSLALND